MAQWLGQFSGNTHQTKVQDREHQLRHAVELLRTKQSETDRHSQMKTVLRLAEQLQLARLRALNGQIAALDPRDSQKLAAAKRKLDQLTTDGVPEILREFRVDNIGS